MTIYERIKETGVEIANWCSYLQFPKTPETKAIVDEMYPSQPTVLVVEFRNPDRRNTLV